MTNKECRAVAEQLRQGRRIGAIKVWRDATGDSLKDAKHVIDGYLSMTEANHDWCCREAAEKFLMNYGHNVTSFESWLQEGTNAGYFDLIAQVKAL